MLKPERRGGYQGGVKEGEHPWHQRGVRSYSLDLRPITGSVAALKQKSYNEKGDYVPTYGVRYADHMQAGV